MHVTLGQHRDGPDAVAAIHLTVAPLRARLLSHDVYPLLNSPAALRIFLEHQGYAVWESQALHQCLQQRLASTLVPWPVPAPAVNGLDTGLPLDGGNLFDPYRQAMADVGADTQSVAHFTGLITTGMPWWQALMTAAVPAAAHRFVRITLEVCQSHPVYDVAAFFLFGRSPLIPERFRRPIAQLGTTHNLPVNGLMAYLDRHGAVDDEAQGPASATLLRQLCGDDQVRWRMVQRAAERALRARIALWDGIATAIRHDGHPAGGPAAQPTGSGTPLQSLATQTK